MADVYFIRRKKKLWEGWEELWQFRELAILMAWREIKVKYKQAFFGILWTVFQPVFLAVVFYFIFRSNPPVGKGTSMPYILFVFSGMVLWNFFSSALQNSLQQMLGSAQIIKKIYFPRIYIPLSSFVISGFDFIFSFFLLCLLVLYQYGFFHLFSIQWWGIGYSLVLVFVFSMSIGIYLSAMVVKYRDFRFATGFLLQALFFISPVFYEGSREEWKDTVWEGIFKWHPVGIILDIFRNSLTGNLTWQSQYGLAFFIGLGLFILSMLHFRRVEEYMADII